MKYTYEEKLKLTKIARKPREKRPLLEYQIEYINKVNITECELKTRNGKTKYYHIENKNKRENSPLIITVHGGGFCNGYTKDDTAFAAMLAVETNSIVLDIDYKLAPEYTFPVAYEEVYDITKWAYENSEELGIDKSKIILCGSSAGGNLVSAVVMEATRTKDFQVKLQILDYPATDLYTDPEKKLEADKLYMSFERARAYNSLYTATEEELKNPYVSMIFATKDMLKGIPDALVIMGELDALHIEGEKYAFMMMEAGVKVTIKKYLNSNHGFIVHCIGEEWLDAHRLIAKTINNI
ncbi:MAG: alpha/beta hydrolase [Clostridium perfringens]|nr:alpha/beta hydrolase [Clostridium perfringens]